MFKQGLTGMLFTEKITTVNPMAELLRDHFVVILLVLFAGVLYWGFQPRKKKRNQDLAGKSSSDTIDKN